jgi:predicted TIM-barrel fold metal-dependent hydrolase
MEQFDRRGAMANGGEAGSYDIAVRIAEMDTEGVACDIVHSGTQSAPPLWYGAANHEYSPELRFAGVQAYHRWLADFMAASDGRLFGVAEPGPCLDVDATVKELAWLAANGFVSVGVPGITADPALPPLHDRYYDPIWAACADLGLVLSVHAGWGAPQGAVYRFFDLIGAKVAEMGGELDREQIEKLLTSELDNSMDSPLRLDIGPRRVMWHLMLGGAFDRHPGLKLALTEIRADWLPPTLAALDALAAGGAGSAPGAGLSMTPTQYFRRHCAIAPSSIHRSEIEMRHDIGIDQLLFATDYPHHEGTWPNTKDWIVDSMASVPETEARQILGENAIAFYGLDRSKLAAIADRIGFDSSEVLGGPFEVDVSLVGHFHKRAGYTRPADPIDTAMLERIFTNDLVATRGT